MQCNEGPERKRGLQVTTKTGSLKTSSSDAHSGDDDDAHDDDSGDNQKDNNDGNVGDDDFTIKTLFEYMMLNHQMIIWC